MNNGAGSVPPNVQRDTSCPNPYTRRMHKLIGYGL